MVRIGERGPDLSPPAYLTMLRMVRSQSSARGNAFRRRLLEIRLRQRFAPRYRCFSPLRNAVAYCISRKRNADDEDRYEVEHLPA
jgi:hypothetical protein